MGRFLDFGIRILDTGLYTKLWHLIWIPKDAKAIDMFKFKNIEVKLIDAESALVSKAIHAPQKNKQLIRQAIASGNFPALVDRIIENNGKLVSIQRA